jgi:hypothetical protein
MGHTVHLGDNRIQQVNLMDIPIGLAVCVTTKNSTWHFCRVEGSRMDEHGLVTGVMVATDSRIWGQALHGPFQTSVDANIVVGKAILVKIVGKNAGMTGTVLSLTYERH